MNTLTIEVPGREFARRKKQPNCVEDATTIKKLLTQEDIAVILCRPVRWVRENLLATGIIKSVRLGKSSYRVSPDVFDEWVKLGCPGCESLIEM